ncbi:MAG: hypothetical protein CSA49_05125 [Gammaproteobacteria bacterium]|nr:MAG: hypothetical protein CSA49_05125 [Gammaproteobacteria bacterium]
MNVFGLDRTKGFTVLELLVTLMIAVIVVAVGVPSMQAIVQKNRIASQSRAVITALQYARSEAVTQRNEVNIDPTDGSDWSNGITVWVDTDGNNSINTDNSETLQVYEPLVNSTLAPSATVARITFDDNGFMAAPGAALSFTLKLDECKVDGRTIQISQNGRVSISTVACP